MSEVTTHFYIHAHAAWDAMLDDIKNAQKSIDIEQYIFTIDQIGKKFLDALYERVQHGVKVRILCDAVGSNAFYNSVVPETLKNVGIEVRFFNPISTWRLINFTFTSNFFRDHRKIMIIDGHIGHVGSTCIQVDMADWRDTQVRIKGDLVQDLTATFETLWNNINRGFLMRFSKSTHFVKNFKVEINAPRPGQRQIYQELVSNMRNAEKYIYLTTPYFVPDGRLYRILKLAAKKGIDVRLLVPDISDLTFVDHAGESYFSAALKAGVKIYLYKPSMMHAKTAVIDDMWATAGSFNLDSLSFYYNTETNISSEEAKFIQTLKDHFEADIVNSRELTHEDWQQRPLKDKIFELLTWPFHGIL